MFKKYVIKVLVLALGLSTLGLASLSGCGLGKGVCVPRIPGDKRINGSYIHEIGRFGNQLYYYLFLKIYSKNNGLTLETLPWLGNQLFGFNDTGISVNFCKISESEEVIQSYKKENDKVFVNRDFYGYFQLHTSVHAQEKDYIRSLFTPVATVKNQLQPALDKLRASGHTLVAVHMRRGDMGYGPFVISPTKWYLDWLQKNWGNLDNPILYVASDSMELVLKDFSAYNPVIAEDLGLKVDVPKADFYPDFYVLSQADALLISNSTFSSSAALLNVRSKYFLRPDFEKQQMVDFDPWSTYPWESWHSN